MSDAVTHPPHYNSHPSGVECITVTEHMSFNLGNAVKYIWRADEKGKALEDLRKAAWYVQREIERREAVADVFDAERPEGCGCLIPVPTGSPIHAPSCVHAPREAYCLPAKDWHDANIFCSYCEPILKAAAASLRAPIERDETRRPL